MAHLPYYNSKAHEIPSVTHIISLLNKKGLMDWSNWLGLQRIKYRAFLDEKALLGTLVHNKIECDICKTHYSPHIDYKLEREADVRFNYYLQWKRDCNVIPKYSELRLHNERYGGTIDFIGTVNNELALVDFKTSKKPHFTHFMQLAAYLNLLQFKEPEIYDKLTTCRIVCFTGKADVPIISKSKRIEEMVEYRTAFEKLYEAFIVLNHISIEDWKGPII